MEDISPVNGSTVIQQESREDNTHSLLKTTSKLFMCTVISGHSFYCHTVIYCTMEFTSNYFSIILFVHCHGLTVRLTVSGLISWSHSLTSKSHGFPF